MSCIEIQTKKYQTRKSPAYKAQECKNQTKRGKNGNYVSKADSRGIFKWTKLSKTKSYLIHNNGTRPYRVTVSGNNVAIYKNTESGPLIKTLVVKQIHVGKYDGAFGHGNSILLDLGSKKYIHIGFDIYEFSMLDDFEAYYSLIGNSDVPYPILLGSKYVYFMLDFIYLPRTVFKAKMTAKEWEDAYQYFYGYKDYETGNNANTKSDAHKIKATCGKKFKNLKMLKN